MEILVFDTSVLISALRSRRGASFRLLRTIGETWIPLISVAMILEYEAIGLREASLLGIPAETIDAIITRSANLGERHRIISA